MNKAEFTQEESRIFLEASQRMSAYVVYEGDKISVSKSAEELHIDQDLYDKWYYVINLYNDGKIDVSHLPVWGGLSKSNTEDESSTGTRGGNIMCDVAAAGVSAVLNVSGMSQSQS